MARKREKGFNLLEEERVFFDAKVLAIGNTAAAKHWNYSLSVITKLFLHRRRCPGEFLLILRADMEDHEHIATKKDIELNKRHLA